MQAACLKTQPHPQQRIGIDFVPRSRAIWTDACVSVCGSRMLEFKSLQVQCSTLKFKPGNCICLLCITLTMRCISARTSIDDSESPRAWAIIDWWSGARRTRAIALSSLQIVPNPKSIQLALPLTKTLARYPSECAPAVVERTRSV